MFSATEGIKTINSYHRYNNSNNDGIEEYRADPYNNWLTLPKFWLNAYFTHQNFQEKKQITNNYG